MELLMCYNDVKKPQQESRDVLLLFTVMQSPKENTAFLNLGDFIDTVVTWMRSELQLPNWSILSDFETPVFFNK